MVANSGTAVCADRLRPLNQPRPIHVETDERGYPVAVGLRMNGGTPSPQPSPRGRGGRLVHPKHVRMDGGLVAVAEILDRWRIDDEWWRPALQGDGTVGRAEISRMYYHVALRNRQLLVIFHDLVEDGWYVQTNATPLNQPEPLDILTPRVPAAASRGALSPSDRSVQPRRIGMG